MRPVYQVGPCSKQVLFFLFQTAWGVYHRLLETVTPAATGPWADGSWLALPPRLLLFALSGTPGL
jgi:hypothetical protein